MEPKPENKTLFGKPVVFESIYEFEQHARKVIDHERKADALGDACCRELDGVKRRSKQ